MQLFKKIMNSIGYSIDGVIAVWKKEQSFRLEIYACFIALPLIYFLWITRLEKLILILLLMLLLAIELFNSAIEALVDRISSEIHPLSKLVKDASSAAVAIVILMNVIAWVSIVFIP